MDRNCPQIEFPAWAHVPGVTKRPHGLFANRWPPVSQFNQNNWQMVTPYLLGFDLYNFRFYWEAHEAWEEVWHLCKKHNSGKLLKSLIFQTAALLKLKMNQPEQTISMLNRAATLMAEIQQDEGSVYLGVDLVRQQQDFKLFADKGSEDVFNTAPKMVIIF